ncbi:hypothetical protein WJX81_007357 [Elliptochloris bilobata]|uniref:NEK6-subfamily protein kinase n=1 Tax=Elliptochloris bilobata TaxID=381761 RepID=A0AAW1RHW3_9CHLO
MYTWLQGVPCGKGSMPSVRHALCALGAVAGGAAAWHLHEELRASRRELRRLRAQAAEAKDVLAWAACQEGSPLEAINRIMEVNAELEAEMTRLRTSINRDSDKMEQLVAEGDAQAGKVGQLEMLLAYATAAFQTQRAQRAASSRQARAQRTQDGRLILALQDALMQADRERQDTEAYLDDLEAERQALYCSASADAAHIEEIQAQAAVAAERHAGQLADAARTREDAEAAARDANERAKKAEAAQALAERECAMAKELFTLALEQSAANLAAEAEVQADLADSRAAVVQQAAELAKLREENLGLQDMVGSKDEDIAVAEHAVRVERVAARRAQAKLDSWECYAHLLRGKVLAPDTMPLQFLPRAELAMGKVLGSGGYGEVVAAQHAELPPLAVKAVRVLPALGPGADANEVASYVYELECHAFEWRALGTEATLGALLRHDNLGQALAVVDEAGEGEGRVFSLAFAAVNNGTTLADLIATRRKERRTFSLDEIVHVLEQLSAALQHMHDRGWVHLDVKPGNVLVAGTVEGGRVPIQLIDLGLAVPLGAKGNRVALDFDRGTPGFRCPGLEANPDCVWEAADGFSAGRIARCLALCVQHTGGCGPQPAVDRYGPIFGLLLAALEEPDPELRKPLSNINQRLRFLKRALACPGFAAQCRSPPWDP